MSGPGESVHTQSGTRRRPHSVVHRTPDHTHNSPYIQKHGYQKTTDVGPALGERMVFPGLFLSGCFWDAERQSDQYVIINV